MIIVSSESDETTTLAFFFRGTRFNGIMRSSSIFSLLSNREDWRVAMKERIGEIVKRLRLFGQEYLK